MKFERNEVTTGLLVLTTVGVLIAVILLLSAPGLFHSLNTFEVFFDNASGVRPGASVLVAGRKIGQVTAIDSPVAKAKRPAKYPDNEVLITVSIEHNAHVYRNATARMQQNGLLGEVVIDFVGGSEESGIAESGYQFVGERVPDLNSALPRVLAVIEPVASTATLTLGRLGQTIDSLNSVFGQEGELRGALTKLRMTADNLTGLTAPDGSLNHSLANLQDFTGKLKADDGPLFTTLNNLQKTTADINKDNRVPQMLANFEEASVRASAAANNANKLIAGLSPTVLSTLSNLNQMTDTLKRQPWRIVWPTTKKYDATVAPDGVAASSPKTAHERRSIDYGEVSASRKTR